MNDVTVQGDVVLLAVSNPQCQGKSAYFSLLGDFTEIYCCDGLDYHFVLLYAMYRAFIGNMIVTYCRCGNIRALNMEAIIQFSWEILEGVL